MDHKKRMKKKVRKNVNFEDVPDLTTNSKEFAKKRNRFDNTINTKAMKLKEKMDHKKVKKEKMDNKKVRKKKVRKKVKFPNVPSLHLKSKEFVKKRKRFDYGEYTKAMKHRETDLDDTNDALDDSGDIAEEIKLLDQMKLE